MHRTKLFPVRFLTCTTIDMIQLEVGNQVFCLPQKTCCHELTISASQYTCFIITKYSLFSIYGIAGICSLCCIQACECKPVVNCPIPAGWNDRDHPLLKVHHGVVRQITWWKDQAGIHWWNPKFQAVHNRHPTTSCYPVCWCHWRRVCANACMTMPDHICLVMSSSSLQMKVLRWWNSQPAPPDLNPIQHVWSYLKQKVYLQMMQLQQWMISIVSSSGNETIYHRLTFTSLYMQHEEVVPTVPWNRGSYAEYWLYND